jgi:hypothetical protein
MREAKRSRRAGALEENGAMTRAQARHDVLQHSAERFLHTQRLRGLGRDERKPPQLLIELRGASTARLENENGHSHSTGHAQQAMHGIPEERKLLRIPVGEINLVQTVQKKARRQQRPSHTFVRRARTPQKKPAADQERALHDRGTPQA